MARRAPSGKAGASIGGRIVDRVSNAYRRLVRGGARVNGTVSVGIHAEDGAEGHGAKQLAHATARHAKASEAHAKAAARAARAKAPAARERAIARVAKASAELEGAARDVKVAERRAAPAKALTVAEIGEVHEFGLGVPERSFIRGWYDEKPEKLRRAIKREILAAIRNGTEETCLERIALTFQADIMRRFQRGIGPPLSPQTIKRKGSSKQLIDTGILRSAILGKAHEGK